MLAIRASSGDDGSRMDTDTILRRSSELIEIAEAAGFGHLPWIDFNRALAEIVPDSSAVFFQNHYNLDAPQIVQHGLGIDAMIKYKAHFEEINPWNAFWLSARTGTVYRSSEVMPAQSFRHTEFYNDWLASLGNRFDGIGIKLGTSDDVSLMLSMQLPDKRLQQAETLLEPLLANIGGALIRAVSINTTAKNRIQKSAAAAAIVNRSPDMAFAVDQYFTIVEANAEGEHSLFVNGATRSVGGKLRIASEAAQRWLQSAVQALVMKRPLAQHRFTFRLEQDVHQLSVFRIPEHGDGHGFLLGYRYLLLVIVRRISGRLPQADLGPLLNVFGLTPAEIKMCEALLQDLTIAEVADRLQITLETARHRLKQIFHKTGTNRQAQLVALLMRVS